MKKQIKKMSDTHLLETNNLIQGIKNLVERDFSHVSQHLPKDFKKSINEMEMEIDKEISKREL